eukprot:5339351-Prymnesium_polylepis.1
MLSSAGSRERDGARGGRGGGGAAFAMPLPVGTVHSAFEVVQVVDVTTAPEVEVPGSLGTSSSLGKISRLVIAPRTIVEQHANTNP